MAAASRFQGHRGSSEGQSCSLTCPGCGSRPDGITSLPPPPRPPLPRCPRNALPPCPPHQGCRLTCSGCGSRPDSITMTSKVHQSRPGSSSSSRNSSVKSRPLLLLDELAMSETVVGSQTVRHCRHHHSRWSQHGWHKPRRADFKFPSPTQSGCTYRS
jgi:hypothetical protein